MVEESELREKIAREIMIYGLERGVSEREALDIADNILALPEMEALRLTVIKSLR